MNIYHVIDNQPGLRIAALRDSLGRHYVVRVGAQMPPIGIELRAQDLRRGRRALMVDHSGRVFDTTVDAEACTQDYVFERMHPFAGPAR
jgi:hypothetical protein